MYILNPNQNWKWVGPFLWLKLHYDHRFESLDSDRTKLTRIVGITGPGARIFGRLFAAIYARNLNKAIPRLIAELQSDPPDGAG